MIFLTNNGARRLPRGRPQGPPPRALDLFTRRVREGRAPEARPGNAQELKATAALRLPLIDVAAKARTGGPLDDPEDMYVPPRFAQRESAECLALIEREPFGLLVTGSGGDAALAEAMRKQKEAV